MRKLITMIAAMIFMILTVAWGIWRNVNMTKQKRDAQTLVSKAKETNKSDKNIYNSNNKNNKNNNYRKALGVLWGKVYPAKGKTFYCGYDFDNSKKSARNNNINAEHIFPASWMTYDLKCGTRKQCQKNNEQFRIIESDLHNIYPANVQINKARSNYKFANISGEKREFGNCDFEVNRKSRIAEPKDSIKGEIARAMLYMESQYNLTIKKKTKNLIIKWNRQDPPNKEELRRQKAIYKAQGRENKFITQYDKLK